VKIGNAGCGLAVHGAAREFSFSLVRSCASHANWRWTHIF